MADHNAENNRRALGENVQHYRETRGWSLSRLSEELRECGKSALLSESSLSRLENGKAATTTDKLFFLAQALGTPVKAFFNAGGTEDLPRSLQDLDDGERVQVVEYVEFLRTQRFRRQVLNPPTGDEHRIAQVAA
jgi:transcriptional regulator with XRE-family HTH domain